MEAPKEIYMDYQEYIDNRDLALVARHEHFSRISVSIESRGKYDVKYIRADIHEAEISKLQTQLAEPKDSEAPADAVNGAVAKVGGYRYQVEETTERVPCTGKCKCLQCAGEEYWNKLSKKTKELNQENSDETI